MKEEFMTPFLLRTYVVYEGGVHDTIPAKNLREGDPLKLSPIERAFWVKKELPSKIHKYV